MVADGGLGQPSGGLPSTWEATASPKPSSGISDHGDVADALELEAGFDLVLSTRQ